MKDQRLLAKLADHVEHFGPVNINFHNGTFIAGSESYATEALDSPMAAGAAYASQGTFRECLEQLVSSTTEEVVHKYPLPDSSIMPCCGKTPFDVPLYHRLAIEPKEVTCRGDT